MNPRANQRGVTLLELLAAITLLSLLTTGVLLAMRVGFNSMHMTNDRLLESRRVLRVQRILEQQIAGLMPVFADCLAPPGAPPVRIPFFQGEAQSMRLVSSFSLGEASRGYPRILEFLVMPREDREGVRLVVNEHLFTGPASAGRFCLGWAPDRGASGGSPFAFPPIQAGPQSFVLADRLAYCRFVYQEAFPTAERWTPRWDRPKWPSVVRVELAPLEAPAGRLPLLTMTAPIRINRVPNATYADF